jgi:hypothetical protein
MAEQWLESLPGRVLASPGAGLPVPLRAPRIERLVDRCRLTNIGIPEEPTDQHTELDGDPILADAVLIPLANSQRWPWYGISQGIPCNHLI